MTKIQIILGSTRPSRIGEPVARWIHDIATQRSDIQVELVDIQDYDLPLLDEPIPPSIDQYSKEHTKKWAAKIAEADGYVFVTAEYNHGVPAALKNAIDFIYKEWNNKAAGFVSYGSAGGVRAVEQLRQIMAEVQIADVRADVRLYLDREFENYRVFKPTDANEKVANTMLDQLTAWANALKTVREEN